MTAGAMVLLQEQDVASGVKMWLQEKSFKKYFDFKSGFDMRKFKTLFSCLSPFKIGIHVSLEQSV